MMYSVAIDKTCLPILGASEPLCHRLLCVCGRPCRKADRGWPPSAPPTEHFKHQQGDRGRQKWRVDDVQYPAELRHDRPGILRLGRPLQQALAEIAELAGHGEER